MISESIALCLGTIRVCLGETLKKTALRAMVSMCLCVVASHMKLRQGTIIFLENRPGGEIFLEIVELSSFTGVDYYLLSLTIIIY